MTVLKCVPALRLETKMSINEKGEVVGEHTDENGFGIWRYFTISTLMT
jgi:hypothetical protein